MKSLFLAAFSQVDLGLFPSIGVTLMFLTMSAIILWTFRPSLKQQWEQRANLVADEGQKK
jgi:cbb3-type cytochrome oxidase subunit 3